MIDLSKLTLAELVLTHNANVPADARVRRFRDRATAQRRTAAVLPAGAGRAIGKRRLDLVESLLRGGAALSALMAATGRDDRGTRADIDAVRRRGNRVVKTAPKTWALLD
jgi:hypothetical protein